MLSVLLSLGWTVAAFQEPALPESATRDMFIKEFKDKNPAGRNVAVRRLVGLTEEKTMLLLGGALKDPEVLVRKASAEVILTCNDVAGATLKPLCACLMNKKEDKDVRSACARALARAHFKAEPIDALVQTISGISEQDRDLYAFGADCTRILGELAGQDFGAGKETPDKWKKWWKDNQAKLTKEDQEKLAAYRKSAAAKGK